jgi:hypothetical protein
VKGQGKKGWIVTGLVLGLSFALILAGTIPEQQAANEKRRLARNFSLHRLYASQSSQASCPDFALDDPPSSPLTGPDVCLYDQSATCAVDKEEVERAGIPLETYCSALFEPGGCLEAAGAYGVSASCLCSLVIAERSWSDHDLFTKRWSDGIGLGATVGCIQQSPGTIWEAIQKLKVCQPEALLLFRHTDLAEATPSDLRRLMMESCPIATELAALWLVAQAHPSCNNGLEGTCLSFAENWNPGDGGRLNGGSRGLLNFGPQIRTKAKLTFGILRSKPELASSLPGDSWSSDARRMLFGPQLEFEGPPWDPPKDQPPIPSPFEAAGG